ncbi:MAG TPA: DUF488 domain-containing protein [Candidatus Thermoplasmatota archaeon]|nr:DUF488 domain-containing protein [Candidatus Thermoplasmatota archaeon]
MELLTVGHSNRTFEEFLDILRAHGVQELVDIRTVPKSLRVPWSAGAVLGPALEEAGIGYRHEKDLGGLRRPRKDSPNGAWRVGGFQGYADWMQGQAFQAALERLLALARSRRTVVMCAEAVPWRCHRRVLADAVVARGGRVFHLMSPARADRHEMPAFARVRGTQVSYPDPQKRL